MKHCLGSNKVYNHLKKKLLEGHNAGELNVLIFESTYLMLPTSYWSESLSDPLEPMTWSDAMVF